MSFSDLVLQMERNVELIIELTLEQEGELTKHYGTHTLWITLWLFSISRLRQISPLLLWPDSLVYFLGRVE